MANMRKDGSSTKRQKAQLPGPKIEVEPDTHNPDSLWEQLKQFYPAYPVGFSHATLSAPHEFLRFVCISDTHAAAEAKRVKFAEKVPDGDVLLHAGDFTMAGMPTEIRQFNSFMAKLPHRVKVVIAGNHEVTFDEFGGSGTHPTLERQQLGLPLTASHKEVAQACKDCLQDVLYLQDETVEICGIKIYGTPWVPRFGTWGFGLQRGLALLKQWDKIPDDTDILLTHTPPLGYGDIFREGKHAGCAELLNTVAKRVKPKFHVFGHVHNGYGIFSNGKTTFINASVCNDRYRPINDPIVFDFPLPAGYCREDFLKLSLQQLQEQRLLSISCTENGKELKSFSMKKITDAIESITAGAQSQDS